MDFPAGFRRGSRKLLGSDWRFRRFRYRAAVRAGKTHGIKWELLPYVTCPLRWRVGSLLVFVGVLRVITIRSLFCCLLWLLSDTFV